MVKLDDDLRILLGIMDAEGGVAGNQRSRGNHRFGPPYVSVYRIAVRLRQDHKNHDWVQKYPVGGEGAGKKSKRSLAMHIGGFLSRLANDPGSQVQGAFISHQGIAEFSFHGEDGLVRATNLSSTGSSSMFRRRPAG